MKGPRIVEYLYLCITDSACSFKQSEIDEENVLSLSYEIISDLNDLLNILPKKKTKNLNTSSTGRKIHKLSPVGPFKSPCID